MSYGFYRFIRFVTAPIVRILWPTKVVNKHYFDEMGGGIVICNHYAIPDTLIPVMSLYKKELHVLAKAEAFECAKIANWFLRKIGAIPVHRGQPDINAVKEVLSVLKADKKLVMYPEGTRNAGIQAGRGTFCNQSAETRFANAVLPHAQTFPQKLSLHRSSHLSRRVLRQPQTRRFRTRNRFDLSAYAGNESSVRRLRRRAQKQEKRQKSG